MWIELRNPLIRSAITMFCKRLSRLYQSHALLQQCCSTIDVEAILSILFDYEKEYTDLKINGRDYSVLPIVNWVTDVTIDNIDIDSVFYTEFKHCLTDLAKVLVEELSEYKLSLNNHEHIRYHYERCCYGQCIRLRSTLDFDRS